MKKIIYITERFPYPPNSGGKIKTLNTLNTLAQKYQVHLISFSPKPIAQKNQQFIKEKLNSSKLFINPEINDHVKQNPHKLIANYLKGIPHLIFQYQNQTAYQKIQNLIKQVKPDVIHIDHLNMAQYLPAEKQCTWILEEHNLESSLLWSRFIYHKHLKTKLFLLAESILAYFYEHKILNQFDAIFTISIQDKEILEKKLEKPFISSYLLPANKLQLTKQIEANNILFIGDLSWHPNRDAIVWFIKKVFPLIKQRIRSAQLNLVGVCPPELKQEYETADIIFYGYQKEIKPFLQKARLFILPFRIGEGIRIKALTALSAGIPLVSTKTGVKGLNLKSKKNYLLANREHDFANHVVKLIKDRAKAQSLIKQGYRYLNQFHQEKNNQQFLREYQEIILKYQ